MTAPGSVAGLGAGLAAITASTALLAALWRRRDATTARSLLGLATASLLGVLAHVVVADSGGASTLLAPAADTPGGITWVVPGVVSTVWAGGIWSLFAFQYTGRGVALRRIVAAAAALLSIGALAAAVHAATAGLSPLSAQVLAVCYLLAGFLVTVGVFVLLWASVGHNAFPIVEPVVLSGGIVILLSGSLLAQVFDRAAVFPAAVALASVVFLGPVWRSPLFETLPAARVAGRDRVVEELGEGILVADRDGRLRDLNPAAESLLAVSRQAVRGEPVSTVLGSRAVPEAVLEARGPVRVEVDGTTLEVTGDPVADRRDRRFGTVLCCTDVTDRRIREEQLTLLGRFVVDVVRDRIETVEAEAAAALLDESGTDAPIADETDAPIADETDAPGAGGAHTSEPGETGTDEHDDHGSTAEKGDARESAHDPATAADSIWATTTALATLVARARSVERAIARDGDQGQPSADLRSEIESIADAVATDREADLAVDVPDDPFAPDLPRGVFEVVLETVLEDAIDPETPTSLVVRTDPPGVVVSGDRSDPPASTTGRRDGWPSVELARLATELVGGSLAVSATPDGRRRVTIRLPAPSASRADGAATPPESEPTESAPAGGDG